MNKKSTEKYVTQAVFGKEIKGLHQKIDVSVKRLDDKIDTSTKRLDDKIDNLTAFVVKNHQDFLGWKQTVATKEDTNRILDGIDAFTKRVEVFDRKVLVHDHRINELEPKVDDHEKRLTSLESSRSGPSF